MSLMGALNMVDYMIMALSHVDTTETGGSSYGPMPRRCASGRR
jgi:hypothetical protein